MSGVVTGRFGDNAYAVEKLVAGLTGFRITAKLACSHFGRGIVHAVRVAITFVSMVRMSPLLFVLGLALALVSMEPLSATAQESAAQEPRYVGSTTCVSCHQSEFEAWRSSHHSWALREPSAANVLADFDADDFAHKNVVTRFSQRDGKYVIETDGKDGEPAEFEIKYVVGVEPLQQYLVELEDGRLQALDVVWDTEKKRWYHLYSDDDNKAGDGLHWTGPYKNWNARCAEYLKLAVFGSTDC